VRKWQEQQVKPWRRQEKTKEELKVKELLILDLTKKQQETEFRLNSFIALYEEVKNARNKYVSSDLELPARTWQK